MKPNTVQPSRDTARHGCHKGDNQKTWADLDGYTPNTRHCRRCGARLNHRAGTRGMCLPCLRRNEE